MNNILKYFLSGFIALIPVIILYQAMKSVSVLWRGVFPDSGFLLTFLFSVLIIIVLGFFLSKGLGGFFRNLFEKKSKKNGPLSFIFKFFLNFKAFSEKTKSAFGNPVYFEVSDGIYKLGFITDESVEFLSEENKSNAKVAVYSPDPISFIGELLFIEKRMLKNVDKKDKENIPIFLYTAGIIKKIKDK